MPNDPAESTPGQFQRTEAAGNDNIGTVYDFTLDASGDVIEPLPVNVKSTARTARVGATHVEHAPFAEHDEPAIAIRTVIAELDQPAHMSAVGPQALSKVVQHDVGPIMAFVDERRDVAVGVVEDAFYGRGRLRA
jgi:hypothetical protein